MIKTIVLFFIFLISTNCYSSTDEKRIALLIGNSDYPNLGTLQNPINDVVDMDAALKSLGFETMVGLNLTRDQISKKVRLFIESIRKNKNATALFYYAGHGLEVDGINYLVPVKSNLKYQEDLKSEGVSLDRLVSMLKSANSKMNIIILDACRDNPLGKRPVTSSQKPRSIGKSEVREKAEGLFIAFGTAPGRKAADGIGRNGLFTKHVLKTITLPNLSIDEVFNQVRAGVLEESQNKQMTWQNSALIGTGKFYFNDQNTPVRQTSTTNQVCKNCPEMVLIPKGGFTMGSNSHAPDEQPQHLVSIKSFYMSETEVTFKQWNQCVSENFCEHTPDDKGWNNNNLPVVNVSWNDAKQYTNWLSSKTGQNYRLPSESEWEYAADQIEVKCTNIYFGQYNGDCGYKKRPTSVKSYEKNAFGLYEMQGNVWEWVEDCKVENHVGAPDDGSARLDGDCSFRILKGASYFEGLNWQRPSVRGWNTIDSRKSNFGFRVVY